MMTEQPTKRELYQAQISKAALIRQMIMLFSVTLLVMLLMWAWSAINDAKNFPLTDVVIQGEFRFMNPDTLKVEVRKQAHFGFFALSVNDVRDAVVALPWVADASVRRIWPDRLEIEVKEHQPVSHWGESSLLNANGEVFTPEKVAMPKKLVRLFGAKGREKEVLEHYLRMSQQAKNVGLSFVRLGMNERASWLVEFDNGLLLRLGQSDIEKRWANFMDIYPVLYDMNKDRLVVVDMRFTNGMAVQLKPKMVDGMNEVAG